MKALNPLKNQRKQEKVKERQIVLFNGLMPIA